MATFVVEFEYNVDRAARQAVHPEHAAYLYELADRGTLLLAGPLVGENGGLLIYEVADRDELRAVLDREPYLRAGFVARSHIRQWEPGKGSWIAAITAAGKVSS
jgi:uncharacterized protein YciI